MEAQSTPKVYRSIAAIAGTLAKTGIAKDRNNTQQNYKFRGIDDVYNALAPLLAENGLVILTNVETREVTERVNAKGTVLFYVSLRVRFDFVCTDDASSHSVVTYGEAMDSGDKATNKAMSAAYKYACLQAFCIPTEGDNDADATTHEVAAVIPFSSNEAEDLRNRLASAKSHADLSEVKGLTRAAWHRMDKPQRDTMSAAVADADKRLVQAP